MIGSVLRVRYELTGLISEGPIFSAYSAIDRVARKDVCVRLVKAPCASEPMFADRIRETVRKYRVLQSPGLESLLEVDQEAGTTFVVGELTRGPSLADRIRKLAPFSIPVSVTTAISLLHALDSVHRAGLVHGDLAPQNIVVLADGETKLQLTGIWESYSASAAAGSMVLPLMAPYLAPEVSAGGQPSQASDCYSVGVLLFELLTGRLPYFAEMPVAMALQHANSPTPNVRSINPSVPVVLDEIVKKAMSKEPANRYAKAGEMLSDLRMLLDALRFGRSLSWPLKPIVPDGGVRTSAPKSKGPQPVAPRMGAIRDVDDFDDARKRKKADRDVPVWLLLVFTFAGAVFVSMLVFWLYINLNKPRQVPVPNVKGLSTTEARQMLQSLHFQMKVGARVLSESSEADRVIDVDPPPGEKVREGSLVSVRVSSGSKYVQVPDLKTLTVDKAKSVLENLNLHLDANQDTVSDPNVPPGEIAKQDPPSGKRALRGMSVRTWLSNGPPDTPPPPSPGQGYSYTIRFPLGNTRDSTDVRIDVTDQQGTRTVYDEIHSGGDQISCVATSLNSSITIKIYYDDKLVETKNEAYGDKKPAATAGNSRTP